LNQKWSVGEDEYVVITLLGKIKGEAGDHAHLLPSVTITPSGIRVLIRSSVYVTSRETTDKSLDLPSWISKARSICPDP
jgi:hypothetical protein